MKKLITLALSVGAIVLVLFVGAIVESFAVPTVRNLKVSNLKVTSLPPWGIAIDYDLENVTVTNARWGAVVSVVADGMTNVAHTLVGDTACTEGSHRVYWNMAADGITAKMANATVSVRYEGPGAYCIIDLSGGINATNYAVSSCHAPPRGGLDERGLQDDETRAEARGGGFVHHG